MSNHPNDRSGLLALADRIEEADGAPMLIDPAAAKAIRLMYAAAVGEGYSPFSKPQSDRLVVAEQRILTLEQRIQKLEKLRVSDIWERIP